VIDSGVSAPPTLPISTTLVPAAMRQAGTGRSMLRFLALLVSGSGAGLV